MRWSPSCPKQHQLITKRKRWETWNWVWSLLCPLPLSVHAQPYNRPNSFFFFALYNPLCSCARPHPPVILESLQDFVEIYRYGVESEVCNVTVQILACPHVTLHHAENIPLLSDKLKPFKVVHTLHCYKPLPKQEKPDSFKALTKSKKPILTIPLVSPGRNKPCEVVACLSGTVM